VQRRVFRETKLKQAAHALSEAVSSPDLEQRGERSEAIWQILHANWSSASYERSAQVRLLAELAPSLKPDSARQATTDLLVLLREPSDFIVREAIARALLALSSRGLPDAQREQVLATAKSALAWTGSTEEAAAWAHAIAALLPDDPHQATVQIVEALKYPTATGTPTDILLEALKKPWPEDYGEIAGKTLPDQDVLDWLEGHLPDGRNLTDPPARPEMLQPQAGVVSRL
jgi:hypothetical protein